MDLLTAENLAIRLMREWGCDGWTFRWSNGKRQLGCAFRQRNRVTGQMARQEIRLSRHLVAHNDEEEVRDVILHEIAHVKAGPGHGHDEHWKAWARIVGARPSRCVDANRVRMVEPKYIVVCGCCNRSIRKAHRRIRLGRRYCRSCGPASLNRLELRLNPLRGQVR